MRPWWRNRLSLTAGYCLGDRPTCVTLGSTTEINGERRLDRHAELDDVADFSSRTRIGFLTVASPILVTGGPPSILVTRGRENAYRSDRPNYVFLSILINYRFCRFFYVIEISDKLRCVFFDMRWM